MESIKKKRKSLNEQSKRIKALELAKTKASLGVHNQVVLHNL